MASGSVEATPPNKRLAEIFQTIIRFDFIALSYLIHIFLMPSKMPLFSPVQIPFSMYLKMAGSEDARTPEKFV
jgi:hypothetical protein